jgi:hypothetical protein
MNNLFIINDLQTLFQSVSYHAAISVISCGKVAHFTACFAVFYTIKCPKPFYHELSTTSIFPILPQITSSISKANESVLSLENQRLLFIEPVKRGRKETGDEALFICAHSSNTCKVSHYKQQIILDLVFNKG